MNIFQLSSNYQSLMDKIDACDEIDDETMQLLTNINDDLENKVMNYASIIKSIEAKAQAIDRAIDSMVKRQDSLLKSAERLKHTVKDEMAKCDKQKIENEYHIAKLVNNNPKVQFSDKSLIPEKYMRRKITEIVEPNTLLISKALKENLAVPGAFLVKEQRLELR